jgi:hypothetical protein
MAWRQHISGVPRWLWLASGLLVLGAAALLVITPRLAGEAIDAPPSRDGAAARSVAVAVGHLVASGQGELGGGGSISAWLPSDARGQAYVALRAGGERVSEAWGEGGTADAAVTDALLDAASALNAEERADVEVIEMTIAGPDVGDRELDGSVADNVDRGVLGVWLDLASGSPLGFPPTRMIADNTSFERVVEIVREEGREPIRAALFEATQLLVDLREQTVHPLVRGAQIVPATQVNQDNVESLATGMGDWLFGQLADDGRMVYEYYPSRGEESTSNNMIRQWMATVAMTRIGLARNDAELLERVARNIDYNLSISYSEDEGLGLIADPDGEVKLGAVALAALAIRQHPARDRWEAEETALLQTVDELWQADGSFRTFYRPADRNDNQNFYPGEALLLWATMLEGDPDDSDRLDRFMASFRYYRAWHREQPNPAFVPWHTMAYEKVWRQTHDPELLEFIFEMTDWLLPMQQWEAAPSPDLAGRFYDPDRPDYGPPHASSDGVYLEGLIAAHRAARAVGDDDRAERYRVALCRGLRNLMQLQFADEVDMYYVSQRERVAGGLRTTPYDNRIRVDNVQHGLMAALDILEAFAPGDYRISGP